MDTPNQPKSEPNAVVVPGEDYQLVVPDLDSPVIDLLNNTATQELVRVTPSADCYSVAYQSSPTAEWESLAETVSMQEAAKKAAYVQEFDIEVVEDSRTGLGQVYLRPGQGSGFAVQSRDHFPSISLAVRPTHLVLGTRFSSKLQANENEPSSRSQRSQ